VFSRGDLPEEKVVLKGIGFTIVNKGGAVEAYKFTKNGSSTARAD
jgi:hypothetical protein